MESTHHCPSPAQIKRVFDIAADTRKFEIGLFWQRSIFFWGFIAAAFVAYAEIAKESPRDNDLLSAIAAFGVVCSAAWALANRGSKYWQGAWEAKLEAYEKIVLGIELFAEPYSPRCRDWWGEWRFSVSRLTMALSDFTFGLWVFLGARTIPGIPWPSILRGPAIIPIISLLYVTLMLFFARSEKRRRV